jgi:hypothetical protein
MRSVAHAAAVFPTQIRNPLHWNEFHSDKERAP